MQGEYPYLYQPGASEQAIVEEMIRNPGSELWKKCHEFVTQKVHFKARNFHWDRQEEIIQEAMYKIARSLPGFRFECSLKSWVWTIIASCIADEYRHLRRVEKFNVVDTLTE